jgi:hypothetical protein
MAGPYRITRSRVVKATGAGAGGASGNDVQAYLDRLTRMIPAEVLGLYLVGSGMLDPEQQATALAVWAAICAFGVVTVRAWGSRDPKSSRKPGPDWTLVFISTVAFIIWIYDIGGPFTAFDIPNRPWAPLAVLVWTFFVPIFYKGV